jgi:hypothetical protein
MLTLVACRYLPFVVCGFLKLVEVVALRLWSLGLNTGRFVRNRAAMNHHVEMEPPNENLNNDLL